MKQTILFLFVFLYNFCFAQTDTSILYYAKDGHETTKDSTYNFIKFYKQNNVWHGKDYYLYNGVLKSEGDYADKSAKTPLGNFNNYNEKGELDYSASYNNGKSTEATYYYKNGAKKSWITRDEKGVSQQKGWDEAGKEIKNFIVTREAQFKGGLIGWRKYLEKNLDANVASDAGAPPGEYQVIVSFKVSPEGNTSHVKATLVPAKCKVCANEAVRVIINSREWEPAIWQNQPVEYEAQQSITFAVIDEKKKN